MVGVRCENDPPLHTQFRSERRKIPTECNDPRCQDIFSSLPPQASNHPLLVKLPAWLTSRIQRIRELIFSKTSLHMAGSSHLLK